MEALRSTGLVFKLAADAQVEETRLVQPPVEEWAATPVVSRLFRSPRFLVGAAKEEQLPKRSTPSDPKQEWRYGEVAFLGRSNVGKSSLINALCNSNVKKLAVTSKRPGRTQQLNFFGLGDHQAAHAKQRCVLVDLPGYGFARAEKAKVDAWHELLGAYVQSRAVEGMLSRVFVLIDARREGITNRLDQDLISFLDDAGAPYQIVLTKVDRLKPSKLQKTVDNVAAWMAEEPRPTAVPWGLCVSSLRRLGLVQARYAVANAFDLVPNIG